MAIFKKLKTLLKKDQPSTAHAHLSPISDRFEAWINSHNWKYERIAPNDSDELRTHHFMMGFRDDNDFSWNCLIRIHEKNQIISLQGFLEIDLEKIHYVPLLAIFNTLNNTISIGSFGIDVHNGTVFTKIGLDGEFTLLSDHALNSYLQGLASLTERAYELATIISKDPNPEQNLLKFLQSQGAFDDEKIDLETDTSGNAYFVPTHTAQ